MINQVESFIQTNYKIRELFYTHDIYNYFSSIGWSQSQISSCLNQLKNKGVIVNRSISTVGFNAHTGKRTFKQWMRVK